MLMQCFIHVKVNFEKKIRFFPSINFRFLNYPEVGGAVGMASWLVSSTPDRAVRVRALTGDIVLCSWARHLTVTAPLSTQVYKWVLADLMLWVALRWTSIPSRGEQQYSQSLNATETGRISGLMGHLGSYSDFTFTYHISQKYDNVTRRYYPFFAPLFVNWSLTREVKNKGKFQL